MSIRTIQTAMITDLVEGQLVESTEPGYDPVQTWEIICTSPGCAFFECGLSEDEAFDSAAAHVEHQP